MSRSPVDIVYTYVQPGCKKVNTTTYVHTGGVSNAYSRIRMARARVHGEAPEGSSGVLFISSQPAGSERRNCIVFIRRQRNASCSSGANRLDGTAETRPGIMQNGGNGLMFDRLRSKRDPVHWEGSGV